MDNISNNQRSNIRKARKRDPIVSVFMHNNPTRCYSITVPASKSWVDFTAKIQKQFDLASNAQLSLYKASSTTQQQSDIDLSELHKYEISDGKMTKIKHQNIFCVQVNENESNNECDSDSISSSHNSSQSDTEQKDNENNKKIIDINERSFGIDLDLFDRFNISKKRSSSKKAMYHFHTTSTIQSLYFHLKQTWLTLKTHSMTVKHIDDKYTLMQDQNNQFSLRTRRIIWPRNLQHLTDAFEYKLNDISEKWVWAILIVHGGKFAGAIYHGNKIVLHKTLSRYVVRKKQGKRQINHLSTSGVRTGSAGGFKRSENERKLLEEIREILSNWMEELSVKCDKIFVHCPGNYNQITLYGNNEESNYLYPHQNGVLNEDLCKERLNEIRNKNKNKYTNLYRLNKRDERIIQIPITTHGVTLKEIERVHYWLSTCWLKKNENEQEKQEKENVEITDID